MADVKPLLARPLEAWRTCEPHAMATRQSAVAMEFGFADAKHDILALAELSAELLAALTELIACKDLKDEESRLRQRRAVSIQRKLESIANVNLMRDEYNRRKPEAWTAARSIAAKMKELKL